MLYTAGAQAPAAHRTLAALRHFAVLRGWHVVHEAHDPVPLHVPARQRTGWRSVERVLVARRATGLVIPALHEVTTDPARQTALRRWLRRLPAFTASPRATDRATRPPGTGRAAAPEPGPGVPAARAWSRSYARTEASPGRLRDDARTHLILLGWPGDTATAIEVLDRLAHPLLPPGRSALDASAGITVRLAVTEQEHLVMDVRIPRPDTAPADRHGGARLANSLANARLQGAEVSCFPSEDARFTTLRALLRPKGPAR